jgi:hypothetical protein
VFNKTLAGDYLTGQIWEVDRNSRTEGAEEIVTEVRSEPIDPKGNVYRVNRVELDAVTGTADLNGSSEATAPKVMFDYTLNGRTPYSISDHLSLGSTGEYNAHLFVNRLGSIQPGQRMTLRIRCSDPVVTGYDGARFNP